MIERGLHMTFVRLYMNKVLLFDNLENAIERNICKSAFRN